MQLWWACFARPGGKGQPRVEAGIVARQAVGGIGSVGFLGKKAIMSGVHTFECDYVASSPPPLYLLSTSSLPPGNQLFDCQEAERRAVFPRPFLPKIYLPKSFRGQAQSACATMRLVAAERWTVRQG